MSNQLNRWDDEDETTEKDEYPWETDVEGDDDDGADEVVDDD